MTNMNMASINTLIRKGYLFAGVIIAANIFVGNEVKASTTFNDSKSGQPPQTEKQLDNGPNNNFDTQKLKGPDEQAAQPKKFFGSLLFGLLSWEGRINFFVGLFFSVANSYLKWWDYNPGGYWNHRIGCLGLRSKRFLNGMLQFEGNLNLERGAFWSFFHIINLILKIKSKRDDDFSWGSFIIKDILRGFISTPLTFHIAKFNLSISISLDSIIWIGICRILEPKPKNEMTSNMGEKNKIINDNNEEENIQKNDKDIDKEKEVIIKEEEKK